jgi:hypothetical protein
MSKKIVEKAKSGVIDAFKNIILAIAIMVGAALYYGVKMPF